jgi:flagellin
MTNESLDATTKDSSKLTDLKSRTGESLNIHSTDRVTVSYVKQGRTYSTTFSIGAKTLSGVLTATAFNGKESIKDALKLNTTVTSRIGVDGSGNTIYTADKGCAMTLTAATGGLNGQISGFTISITNNKGQINKSANAVLDNFSESIRAQNKSENDNAMVFQVGTKANQAIKVGLTDMRSNALGLKGTDGETLNVSTQVKANAAINVLDNAIQKALDQQTTIGSVESRLSYTASNLTTASENVQASESTIRDADMAKEMTNYTKNNVLLQAAQSMLAQANQSSSSVLSLLQ